MAKKKVQTRDDMRKALLGKVAKFDKRLVEWCGVTVEIRQPSIFDRNALQNKCTVTHDDGRVGVDMLGFLVWAVIYNTYIPGTDERVFDDADYDALVKDPTGGFIDCFSEVAAQLTNVDMSAKKKALKATAKRN